MSNTRDSLSNKYVRDVMHALEPPPPIAVRFFYSSPLTIDDPLAPLPPPLTSATSTPKHYPRPFSTFDNVALDRAWLDVRRKLLKLGEQGRGEKSRSRAGTSPSNPSTPQLRPSRTARRNIYDPESKRRSVVGQDAGDLLSESPRRQPRSSQLNEENDGGNRDSLESTGGDGGLSVSPHVLDLTDTAFMTEPPSTTGRPFTRLPTRSDPRSSDGLRPRSASSRPRLPTNDSYNWGNDPPLSGETPERDRSRQRLTTPSKLSGPHAQVPVGVSRLHNVVIPDLQMEPIYWSPVNDLALVVRGTWFYAETMLPVEVDVANMLEAGYIEMKPWTETWKDELNSAVEVGAIGEMKILHKLWPERPKKSTSRPSTARGQDLGQIRSSTDLTADDPEKERYEIVSTAGDLIDVASGPDGPDNKAAGVTTYGRDGTVRSYLHAGVIYANEKEAYLLRPSLQPSDYYGRRPLTSYIRKGHSIGIRVIRGFDQEAWDKIHPPKKNVVATRANEGVSTAEAGASIARRQLVDPTLATAERPNVTDLVLVIHGIGQKLSQKIESYHFTYAINTFRREINVELGTPDIKAQFRSDMGGIMVLPVNWRLSLSFEDGGYRDDADDPAVNTFSLKDITPDGIPSVRSVFSDVLFDIPYYLSSEHSSKMTTAIIKEANRIYRLWCQNNPNFSEYGRVHLIAHSLGSVMAIDILSNQPTHVPSHLKASSTPKEELPLDHFIFDTTSLFCIGSISGFFLLLKRSSLLPRYDRNKPGADSNNSPGVAGERGTFGCIAIDNIYNVINPYDPIAYHLNACVDATYAASLKPAFIPSVSSSWFSNPFRSSAVTTTASSLIGKHALPRLPSNVELETHDFTREEIAEKRMYLLNDNGQIDWLMKYGGGPLEIQYLTMLGAHSSYWMSRDFVRMVCMEIGRPPGKEGTLLSMRPQKRKRGLSLR